MPQFLRVNLGFSGRSVNNFVCILLARVLWERHCARASAAPMRRNCVVAPPSSNSVRLAATK